MIGMIHSRHRLLLLIFLLIFAAGAAMRGALAIEMAAEMPGMSAVVTASSGHCCDGSGAGQDMMSSAACYSACAGVPGVATLSCCAQTDFAAYFTRLSPTRLSTLDLPPDPRPPKRLLIT
ncbi:MAG TPA: hypothetical protein VNN09_13760 [Candidatus Competibacteraceae bacterium]|nr:hypothetical protein [Candidatus Competibacteraceae bacterium]